MTRLQKGSPKAFAWARKMQAARRKVKHRLRRPEEGHFPMSAIFAGKKRPRNNKPFSLRGSRKTVPDSINLRPITLDEAKALHYGQEVWILDRNEQAARVRVGSTVKRWKRDPDRIEVTFKFGLYESFRLGTQEILRDIYLRESENPGAAWHEREEGKARRERQASGAGSMREAYYTGQAVAHRTSKGEAARLGMNPALNPISVLGIGNPPNGKVKGSIAGLIYNRVIEIRAQKTGYKAGYYRHPFSRGSQVQIFGLTNGDLLVHSKAGVKLWQPD